MVVYNVMGEVGAMKMDAHQEKMIGWTYFIVGYFSNLFSKQKLESRDYKYTSLPLYFSLKKALSYTG